MANRGKVPDVESVDAGNGDGMAERVYAQLREAIMTGRFAAGELLSMRSVAAAVGSSTMPARVALRLLQAEGALVDGPNRTMMVPTMSLESLEEIRDVRMALEGCVAERAAFRVTTSDMEIIQAHYDEMNRFAEAGDVHPYLKANFAFHTAIYNVGAGEQTITMIRNLWMRIGPFTTLVAPDVAHMRQSMEAHALILDALWREDGNAAKRGVQKDIREAADSLRLRLRKMETGEGKGLKPRESRA